MDRQRDLFQGSLRVGPEDVRVLPFCWILRILGESEVLLSVAEAY